MMLVYVIGVVNFCEVRKQRKGEYKKFQNEMYPQAPANMGLLFSLPDSHLLRSDSFIH